MQQQSRRHFIRSGATMLLGGLAAPDLSLFNARKKMELDAHLWVFASRYPPDWDCTPILDQVFSDLKYAGYDGVEVMEVILRHEGSVERLKRLIDQYQLPVRGTSYYGDLWNASEHSRIWQDINAVLDKLQQVGGNMIGMTVGDARRMKTEAELDAQADLLKKILARCKDKGILLHLHNHTFEVADHLHDLKGTLARIPDIKLGPDLNWLVRAGVDPVWFIRAYGKQMVYMHIRDQDASGKWTEAVGEGVTDFKAIAKALHDIHYTGRAAVELAFDQPPSRPVRDDWKMSRAYVEKVFGTLI